MAAMEACCTAAPGPIGRLRRPRPGIADLGLGRGEAGDLRLRQIDGVVQGVLARPDDALHRAQALHRLGDGVDGRIRIAPGDSGRGGRAQGAAGAEKALVNALAPWRSMVVPVVASTTAETPEMPAVVGLG